MIEFVTGDLLKSNCDALVNTVNCVGVSGSGLALQFKKKYPEMFKTYKAACENGEVQTGKMHFWKGDKIVINFPTKNHWRNPSKLEWIVTGLVDLARVIKENEIMSISIPPIGCGLGGLSWERVKQEVQKTHDSCWEDIRVVVYENFVYKK